MKKIIYISIILASIFGGCVKPFNPPSTSINANVLVVEGLINAGGDSTFIKLSRTVIVANKTVANAETKAVLTVEDAQGTSYALTETKIKGSYASAALKLDNTKQYRLRIKTINGKTYLSDLVDIKVTPPIDSVGFTTKDKQLQVYVNAHDATNNTRYYKYNFQETWQFHAKFSSDYITNGAVIIARTPAEQIYFCFGNDTSAHVIINSTAALSHDLAYQFPITSMPSTSEKIEIKYSILLTQSALTKTAYTFWENLKKNTEQLGSIFDALPSQLVGNIHNIADASEPVIGYISAGTVQSKRIFITKAQLPADWTPAYPYDCREDSAYFQVPGTKPPVNTVASILIPIQNKYKAVITRQHGDYGGGYLYSSQQCVDCTIRGVIKQPAFWK